MKVLGRETPGETGEPLLMKEVPGGLSPQRESRQPLSAADQSNATAATEKRVEPLRVMKVPGVEGPEEREEPPPMR